MPGAPPVGGWPGGRAAAEPLMGVTAVPAPAVSSQPAAHSDAVRAQVQARTRKWVRCMASPFRAAHDNAGPVTSRFTRNEARSPAGVPTLLLSTYELGRQPLGVATPAAFLLDAGVSVACQDLAVDALDEGLVAGAGLVGISVPMHTALRLGIEVARRIRALRPDVPLCFYGMYAGLNADHLLAEAGADAVIGGEVEEPLTSLALALAAGPVPDDLDGVRTGDNVCPPFLGRQRFRPPARELLPALQRYARFDDGVGNLSLAAAVEASRGCAHVCRHCPVTPVYGRRVRIVPAEVVLADIDAAVAAGARHITFADPDFFNGIRHSMAVARALHARHRGVTFDATIKVEHVLEHPEAIRELATLGCAFIVSAVECLQDDVLERYDKGHTRADVEKALAICRAAGVALRPTFIPFSPWTTAESYLQLLAFVEDHDLVGAMDPVQLAIELLVPPGSALLELPELRDRLAPLDPAALRFPWEHADPRLATLQQRVQALVERDAAEGAPAPETFRRLAAMAREALGAGPGETTAPAAGSVRRRAPGLTHAWFC